MVFSAGGELNFPGGGRRGNEIMKRYVANWLAQFALHTSDIFHVCQQSDATCFSPPLFEIIKESRLSPDSSDYHHPSSSVKNATLFSPPPFSLTFFLRWKKGAFQGPFDKSTKSSSSSWFETLLRKIFFFYVYVSYRYYYYLLLFP